MTKAIIPGTFDPITEGHRDVITRASQLFDEVIVAVASSKNKRGVGTLFTLDERVDLARETLNDLPNVSVQPFTGLLVDFAHEVDAQVIVKGLRAITDFEYEFQMTAMNYELEQALETLFIMSPPKYMYLSSSIVKEIAALQGAFETFVSPCVAEALKQKNAERDE